jgi:hypothetical protein
MVYIYIITILALAGIEGKPLIHEKKWIELAVFSFLLITGTAIIVMDTVVFEPYRVSIIIDFIFRPYTSMVKSFLTSF